MHYQYISSIDSIATYLTETLTAHLVKGEKVVWLTSGGSGTAVSVAVARQLSTIDLSRLSVSLVDERYGPIGHADENWNQLLQAGFSLPTAHVYRPLINKNRPDTTAAFSQWLKDHITQADYSIGLLGIGTDGHTAGIKPRTTAVEASDWAVDFDGEDFERITITPWAIKQLDETILQATGPDKAPIINQLLHENLPLMIQPAQILKQVKKSTLFTDYKES